MKYQVEFVGTLYSNVNRPHRALSDLKWDTRDMAQLFGALTLESWQQKRPLVIVWDRFEIKECADLA